MARVTFGGSREGGFMFVVEDRAYLSYSGVSCKDITIPEFCQDFYRDNKFAAFTHKDDLNQTMSTASNSMSIRGFEVWFSGSCNQKCRYCYFAHAKQINLVETTDPFLFHEERFFRYMKQFKFNHVFLAGGEPLLFPKELVRMSEIMDACSLPEWVELRVPTNGTRSKEMQYVLSRTKRVHFLITAHLENKNWMELLHESERMRKEDRRVEVKILIPPGIAASRLMLPNEKHYSYSMVTPVSEEDRYYSMDDLTYLSENCEEAYHSIFDALRQGFLIGMDAGCLRSMLYETIPMSRTSHTTLTECLTAAQVDQPFSLTNGFRARLAEMRDGAYNRLNKRPLLLSHCGEKCFLKLVDMEKIIRLDTLVNTLCLQWYIKRGFFSSLLATQQYYRGLYNRAEAIQLPAERVDVAVDVDYGRLTGIATTPRDIFSIVNSMRWKVKEVQCLSSPLQMFGYEDIERDYWLDGEGEKLFLTEYSNLKNLGSADLVCVRVVPMNEQISFWLIGRKEDVVKIVRKEARGFPDASSRYYFAIS